MFIEFERGEKHAKKGADISEFLDAFQDAGYLLHDYEIVVDIDNLSRNTIEMIIDEFKLQTKTVWTDRGVHLYFRLSEKILKKEGPTPLGIKVELKTAKNSPYGITVKRNGIVREIENETLLLDFPDILKPKRVKDETKDYAILYGLSEGEGRNNKLFAHARLLDSFRNKNQIIRFINQHIFAEPLAITEIDTLLESSNSTTIQSETVTSIGEAELVIKTLNITNFMGVLYFFDGHRYQSNVSLFKAAVLDLQRGNLMQRFSMSFFNEVVKYAEIGARHISPDMTNFPIRLRNGILLNGQFIETEEYKEFTPYSIDRIYNKNPIIIPEVDQYLDLVSNEDSKVKALLLEMMARCLVTNIDKIKQLSRFFILYGHGRNGKGTFLDLIRILLGPENVSTSSLEQLGKESYLAELAIKLANLGDDLDDTPIDAAIMKNLKNIATGDYISIRKLYSQPISAYISCGLIFSSNHLLKSWEKGDAYRRRVLFVPFVRRIENPNPELIATLRTDEAMEYLLALVIEAYFRLYKLGQYTDSTTVNTFNQHYHDENDPRKLYFEAMQAEDFISRTLQEVFEDWEIYCDEQGINPGSKKAFCTSVKNEFNLDYKQVRVGKILKRIFIARDE